MTRLRYDRTGTATVEEYRQPELTEACAAGHEFCEGSSLHVRARCVTGCPQFQDGSWMARGFCVSQGTAHPDQHDGEAQMVKDWLEASFR